MVASRRPIREDFIERLKDTADIVAVIGDSVQLKQTGAGKYKGLCPFHEEKTPSFSVDATKGLYHCFGCKASGDTLGFLMARESLDFYDAVQRLADHHGLPVEYKTTAEQQPDYSKEQQLLSFATDYYKQQLAQNQPAREYLLQRGLSEAVIAAYQLGYVPSGYDNLLTKLSDEQKETAMALGLIKQNAKGQVYDVFRERIIFPILDTRERPLGFGGRIITAAPRAAKYINSSDSELFHKQHNLFGLPQALANKTAAKQLVVVEGYMDVLVLAGVAPAVACLGTAFTRHHARILLKCTTHLVLAFDGDAAGLAAAERALRQCLPELGANQEISLKFLPPGSDPAALVAAQTSPETKLQAWQAVPQLSLEDYLLQPFSDLSLAASEQQQATAKLIELLSLMPRTDTRVELMRRRFEQALGLQLAIPTYSTNDATRPPPSGFSKKSATSATTVPLQAAPLELRHKLVLYLMQDQAKSAQLGKRWHTRLAELAELESGGAAPQLLGIMQAAAASPAQLYGYAAGLGMSLNMDYSENLAKTAANSTTVTELFEKCLHNIYQELRKHAIDKEDPQLLEKVAAWLKELNL